MKHLWTKPRAKAGAPYGLRSCRRCGTEQKREPPNCSGRPQRWRTIQGTGFSYCRRTKLREHRVLQKALAMRRAKRRVQASGGAW